MVLCSEKHWDYPKATQKARSTDLLRVDRWGGSLAIYWEENSEIRKVMQMAILKVTQMAIRKVMQMASCWEQQKALLMGLTKVLRLDLSLALHWDKPKACPLHSNKSKTPSLLLDSNLHRTSNMLDEPHRLPHWVEHRHSPQNPLPRHLALHEQATD